MKSIDQITCPSCDHQFDVEAALSAQLKTKMEQAYKEKARTLESKYAARELELANQQKSIEAQKAEIDNLVAEKTQAESKRLESKLRVKIQEEQELEMNDLRAQNQELKSAKSKFQEAELQLRKEKRALADSKDAMALELEKQLEAKSKEIRIELKSQIGQEADLKVKERDMLIEKLNSQISDMQTRIEQGSQQVQGEAQELVIEEYLASMFPGDEVTEIGKGKFGADCILTVKNDNREECGRLVIESKRAKSFSKEWIKKIKIDTVKGKGSVPVLVTSVLPEGIEKMGMVDGVWVTDLIHFGELIQIIRKFIIREAKITEQQVDKTDKMAVMYDYLISEEFYLRVTTIVSVFRSLKENIQKQKNSMNTHWSKQLKELDKVIDNTSDMYGSVKGLSEGQVKTIEYLELEDDLPELDQAG